MDADKFAPLLHVYDMDVLNGADDVGSGTSSHRRRSHFFMQPYTFPIDNHR